MKLERYCRSISFPEDPIFSDIFHFFVFNQSFICSFNVLRFYRGQRISIFNEGRIQRGAGRLEPPTPMQSSPPSFPYNFLAMNEEEKEEKEKKKEGKERRKEEDGKLNPPSTWILDPPVSSIVHCFEVFIIVLPWPSPWPWKLECKWSGTRAR